MIAAAKKSGVMLSTYHNRHWDGCILNAVEEMRRKGVIGDVFRIEAHMGGYGKPGDWWRTSKTISGGILYDWGVHLLEYSLQLLQGKLTEVTGFATRASGRRRRPGRTTPSRTKATRWPASTAGSG